MVKKILIDFKNVLCLQYMPTPILLQYEEDANKIAKLEQKNESLRTRLALLLDKGPETSVTPIVVDPPSHLLDDFYIIAQENNVAESQAKSFKNLIRNMGTGSSPILGRKDSSVTGVKKKITPVSSRSVKGQTFFYDT